MENENKSVTFEEALKQLENIVTTLEKDDIALEEMIEYYEKGMQLSKECSEMLKNAEEKMTKILNEQEQLEPFHIQEES